MNLRAVPFGGAGETLKNFLGGHVDIYGGSIPPILGHVKAGKARCILVTTAQRSSALPDTSSAGDLGLSDKATELFRGVIGPAGLPADRLAILQKAFAKATHAEVVTTYLKKRGEVPIGSTSDEFKKKILSEYAANASILKGLVLSKN